MASLLTYTTAFKSTIVGVWLPRGTQARAVPVPHLIAVLSFIGSFYEPHN